MPATSNTTEQAMASLSTINMEKLLGGDAETSENLFRAAQDPGFFYVDLSGPSSRDLLPDLEALFGFSSEYFAQPLDEKNALFRNGVDRGYKPGKGHESFEIATSELQDKSLAFPGLAGAHEAVLARFTERSDAVTKALLRSLLLSIGKPEVEAAVAAGPGDSGLKFISAPTSTRRLDAPDTTHTDGGLITLLWCPLLSSQIEEPRSKEWKWVEPKKDCAIVNVADALQKATGDQLHSCVHRVSQPGDGVEERVFVSYYLRPGTA